jgi:hypothetical protein
MSHHYSGPNFGSPHGDARLDLTDVYAFPKPGDASKSILIMNVHPSASVNPPGRTTPEPFASEARKHTCRAELRRLDDFCGLKVTVLSTADDVWWFIPKT